MRPGPKPMPTAQRLLLGNPGKRPFDDREPTPPPGAPSCPRWLDDEARRLWKALVPQLNTMGVLSRIDKVAIARYCDAWSQWRRNREFLRQNGDVFPLKDDSGRVKCLQAFPQLAQMNRLAQQMDRFEAQFGLTPSSRSTLRVIDVEASKSLNEFDRFLAERHERLASSQRSSAS